MPRSLPRARGLIPRVRRPGVIPVRSVGCCSPVPTSEPWLASEESFLDLVHKYAAIGITDIVIHAPSAEPPHVADPLVFDHIIGLVA